MFFQSKIIVYLIFAAANKQYALKQYFYPKIQKASGPRGGVPSSTVTKGSGGWLERWNAAKLTWLERTSSVLTVGGAKRERKRVRGGRGREEGHLHGRGRRRPSYFHICSKVSRYAADFSLQKSAFFHPSTFQFSLVPALSAPTYAQREWTSALRPRPTPRPT